MSLPSRGRRLSVAPLAGVERQGRGSLGSGGLAVGISHSLPSGPYFIQGTHPLSGLLSRFHQGQSVGGGSSFSVREGGNRAGSPSFSRLLQPVICGDESLRLWRPVIDLSLLNLKVQKTSFKMEPLQSVLLSVRPGDWMVSLDLKDAYSQVPMHPESRKFFRFVSCGKVYQFNVLCFGLSMAPQVFTRVMVPVSAFLHHSGIRLHRYLDDWLIQASSLSRFSFFWMQFFKMETLQSVLLLEQPGDWMVSLDLKDAYSQVPMHPESCKFLRFVTCGKVYQFKVLCFGFSTAPQVFTRVMAPVSAFLHHSGIRLRRYLDVWLIQASSWEQVLLALDAVLQLCSSLGIVVNWEKSHRVPTQRMVYLVVLLHSLLQGFSCPETSRKTSLNW